MFALVGLGMKFEHLTLKAINTLKECDEIFLEKYTLNIDYDFEALTKLIGKKIKKLEREDVESGSFLPKSNKKNVALLVLGDPLIATTHIELLLEARLRGIETMVIPGISILNVIGITGLQPYKFGKTTSISFWQEEIGYMPCGFYKILEENQKINAHTLFLLDPNPSKGKYITPLQAIEKLKECEKMKGKNIINKDTQYIVCSRLCSKTEKIVVGKYDEIKSIDFGPPPHSIIIPAQTHFKEKEYLSLYKQIK